VEPFTPCASNRRRVYLTGLQVAPSMGLAQIGAMQIPNPIHPSHMTPDERMSEFCTILARGLVRLKARQSRELSDDQGESCLDFPANQRSHANRSPDGDA
jgi:hypothetical protein